MTKNIFADLIASSENTYAEIVSEIEDVIGVIDTGAYSLNALLAGSIYGGLPRNKVVALAGEFATGKTFFALLFMKQFLIDNPKGFVFYFESEFATTKKMMAERGIDVRRVALIPVATVEEFRTQATRILDKYIETPEKDRPQMFFILDSLGNLSTTKETEDIASGTDKRDMTRAQLVKGAFRVLQLKLGKAKVPMLLTNHVYNVIGAYFPTKEMSGGSGLSYSASIILFLAKHKDKDGDETTGNRITITTKKSRVTKEHKSVDVLLRYDTGLDRYYGLLELALKAEIFKKIAKKIEVSDGSTHFESEINKNPEKYFTKEVLDQIDAFCKKEFCYGSALSGEEGLPDPAE